VLIATGLGFFGMGGVGPILAMHIRLLEYDLALRYYLLLVAMIALVDLLGGGIAFLIDRKERRSSSEIEV
jgi:ABC-type phosphate/phosphonate transport system permease subunit